MGGLGCSGGPGAGAAWWYGAGQRGVGFGSPGTSEGAAGIGGLGGLARDVEFRDFCISVIRESEIAVLWGVERSLGFVAVQSRSGTITIPAEARRALRLDAPGAQVEVILRDNDLVLIPHLAVPLRNVRDGDEQVSGAG